MNIVKGMHVSAVMAEKGELKLGSVHVNMAWSCRKDNNTGVRTNITSKLGTGSKRLPSTIRLHDGAPQMMQQSSHCAVMWGEKANLSLIWTSSTSGPAYGARLRGLICGPLTPDWTWCYIPKRQIQTFCCVMLCHDDWLQQEWVLHEEQCLCTVSRDVASLWEVNVCIQCSHVQNTSKEALHRVLTISCWKIKEAASIKEKISRTAAPCEVEYVNWRLEACN